MFTLALLFACQMASLKAQQNVEVVNIENEVVAAYMKDQTYFTRPDSVPYKSVMPQYHSIQKNGSRFERPNGKTLKWNLSGIDNVEYINVTLTNRNTMKITNYRTPSANDTVFTLTNLYPQQNYAYLACAVRSDSSRVTLCNGSFRTMGQVRMLSVGGVHNLRDMGGWQTTFGKTIRYGLLYRSGNLDRITKSGKEEFVKYQNVRAELDLRGESKLKYSALGEEYDFIKIVAGSYAGSLEKNGTLFADDVRWVINRLREDKSVDWHCAIGCDRCGTLSFVIGALLGMNEIDLGRDYELSYLANHKRLSDSGGFRAIIRFMRRQGASGDSLAECTAKYLLKNGLSQEDIDYFRKRMLK